MYTLVESNLSDSVANLQRTFATNGYLFFRSFFPVDLVLQMRERVIRVLDSEGWGHWEQGHFIAIEPVRRINSAPFHQCISRLMEQEELHNFTQYPILRWFLSALLGEPIYPHPRKMVRITYPFAMNPQDRVPPHQDLVYVKGERDTFTAWIPLGEYPATQGGLEVSPQTHRHGLFPMQVNAEGRFGCTAIEEKLTHFSWHQAHYRPGDLLIMHSLLLHRSGLNQTRQFRLSLDCRFSSALRSVNEEQLLPPYYPQVPGWEVLSRGWENPQRFVPDAVTQIHKKEKELSEVLLTTSRFVE